MGRQTFESDAVLGTERRASFMPYVKRVLLIGGLGMMAVVPLGALDDERPAMFGWQMYAGAVYLPTVDVVLADGSQEERLLGNLVSGFRPEIDYFEPVARFVCSRESNVTAVHIKREIPAREEVFECAQF